MLTANKLILFKICLIFECMSYQNVTLQNYINKLLQTKALISLQISHVWVSQWKDPATVRPGKYQFPLIPLVSLPKSHRLWCHITYVKTTTCIIFCAYTSFLFSQCLCLRQVVFSLPHIMAHPTSLTSSAVNRLQGFLYLSEWFRFNTFSRQEMSTPYLDNLFSYEYYI